MSSHWKNLSSSLFLLDDKSQRREGWEEDLEAAMDKEEQSVQECFLGNEIFLGWEEQALMEKTSFNLCSAQLQWRWYGLRSISMSCIDKLPSKTHRSIISASPVAILPVSLTVKGCVWMCWNFCMLCEASVYIDIACMGMVIQVLCSCMKYRWTREKRWAATRLTQTFCSRELVSVLEYSSLNFPHREKIVWLDFCMYCSSGVLGF